MKVISFLSRRILWITALSLIWLGLFVLNLVPQLRGDFGWRWPFEPVLDLRRVAPFSLGITIYVPVALWLLRRRTAAGLLIGAVAAGAGLALGAVYVRDDVFFRLYAITISGATGGWHMAATRISDLNATLHQWPQFMADSTSFSSHMGISPPGMAVVYYALISFLGHFPDAASTLARPLRAMQCQNIPLMGDTNAQLAAAWAGMLMPAWSSLTILPLYYLGRRVFGPAPARWSVVWWPLVPSLLIFTPLPNTLYPFPALVMICLLVEGLRRNQWAWVLAAGLVMSLLTFLTFTFLPLLLLAGFLMLGAYWLKRSSSSAERPPWHWPIQTGIWFGLGLSAAWLILYAATGGSFWDIWSEATHAHLNLDRPYGPWLVLHLNDFFMFTGWPLDLLAGAGVWTALRKISSRKSLGEGDIMILAAALTLIGLDLSGTLRGESGRILLFLSPWLLLAAASALDGDLRLGGVLTVVQAAIVVAMIICLRVLDAEFVDAPTAPPAVAALAPDAEAFPSGALFGEAVRLNSFAGKIEKQLDAKGNEQAVLILWLNWEAVGTMEIPYYLASLPVAPDGQTAPAATLQQPFQQLYPTTCWHPGAGELADQVEVPLFKSQAGDWWVSFSLIDGKTGQTLEVLNPDGSRDHQVGLGPFR